GFRAEALEALYRLSDGHPYLLQTYAKAAWDAAAQSPITAEDVAAGAAEAEEELDAGFFGGRYRSAAPAERTVLHAMAGLGDGPVRAEELSAAVALRPAALTAARASLSEKGLIHESGPDELAFSVPAFARFLRRTACPPPPPGPRRPLPPGPAPVPDPHGSAPAHRRLPRGSGRLGSRRGPPCPGRPRGRRCRPR